MNTYISFALKCSLGFLASMSVFSIARAETHIPESYILQDTVWNSTGSPYILEGEVTIPAGRTLTIEADTEIIGSPDLVDYPPSLSSIRGHIVLSGQKTKPIKIRNLSNIFIDRGELTMAHTQIDNVSGIYLQYSRVQIASSTVSHASRAISSKESELSIWDSQFEDNTDGVFIESAMPAVQAKSDLNFAIGGSGNAFDTSGPLIPGVTINRSTIAGNSRYGLKNQSTTTAEAGNNWWGSSGGPIHAGANRIDGRIEVEPWLESEPVYETSDTMCCSSILFIPGLEATRLYIDSKGMMGSSTNQLWEPNRNADVEKLYLNSAGSSTNPLIYSGKPIAKAFGLVGVYGSFMNFLDRLQNQNIVSEWKAFGYDWRKPIAEVVAGTEKKASSTESLVATILDLASHSKTGKVNIIAHSNGGLVTKYLLKTLVDMGKESLIDTVISVGVPYLGTPQAIGALLHGSGQSIAYGTILKESTARGLASNMASAYSLLPSASYFNNIFTPTIVFASSTIVDVNPGSYAKNIQTFQEQSAFIADTRSTRTQPKATDTAHPIKGNQTLLTAANIIHATLDPFAWPEIVTRWAIVGWNAPTVAGVKYEEKTFCLKALFGKTCKAKPIHTDIMTVQGDGTVVAPSAEFNSGTIVSADLKKISEDEGMGISHSNLLEASSTQQVLENIIVKGDLAPSAALPPGMKIGEVAHSQEPISLVISTHSPVDLHVYDSAGRHTGLVANPTSVEDDVIWMQENKIPGSRFTRTEESEGSYESYVYLPQGTGEQYAIMVNGAGVGEFTLDIERKRGDEVLSSIEYANLPVTPLMVASTTITNIPPQLIASSTAASTTPAVRIDIDGDGSVDIQAKSSDVFDPIQYLEAIKKTVTTLAGSTARGKTIVKRIEHIQQLIKTGKFKQASNVALRLDKRLDHKRIKGLTASEKQQIIDMIDTFIAQLDI